MKALLWKDLHVNRGILLVGLGLFLLPWLLWPAEKLYREPQVDWYQPWADVLMMCARSSLWFSMLTVALLGGSAMAAERADRSAEFVAALPIPRHRVILSKFIAAIAPALLIWAANLLAIATIGPAAPAEASFLRNSGPLLAGLTSLVFGSAWICSSFLASPVIACGVGLVAPAVLGMLLKAGHAAVVLRDPKAWEGPLAWLCVVLAIVQIAAGAFYYMRRVEP